MEEIKTKEITRNLGILLTDTSTNDSVYFTDFQITSVLKSKEGINLYWIIDIKFGRYTALVNEEYLESIVDEVTFKKIKEKWDK
jgi:hypothetical protein